MLRKNRHSGTYEQINRACATELTLGTFGCIDVGNNLSFWWFAEAHENKPPGKATQSCQLEQSCPYVPLTSATPPLYSPKHLVAA